MENKKYCQIMKQGLGFFCYEAECAWWDGDNKCCAVLTIAKRLSGQIKVAIAK